jgi:hypothetical protein
MANKHFYRHINVRVDIDAESDREAEEFFQNINIVAQTYDKEGHVDEEYDAEIVDWDDLREEANA